MMAKDTLPFKIKNNVLIGEYEENSFECVNTGELILRAFKSKPDFIGQVDAVTGKETTYQQMKERSVKCALWMKEQGVKRGDIIVISTHNQLDACIPLFASFYIGACTSPWNEGCAKYNVKISLAQLSPKIIFANEKIATFIREAAEELKVFPTIVVFGELDGLKSFESIMTEHVNQSRIDEFSCVQLENGRKDVILIMNTSGSTGTSKSVEVTHEIFTTPANCYMPEIHENKVGIWFASFNWVTSMMYTIRCVLYNAKAVKLTGFDPAKACEMIEKYKVNWLTFESSMCRKLIKSGATEKYDLSSLKRIVITGSSLSPKVHETLKTLIPHSRILIIYGSTETGAIAYQIKSEKNGFCGYVGKNMQIKIVDSDNGKTLGANQRGEIYCKTLSLMNGYYKDSESTKAVINNEGWFHTGDIGYYDEDGEIFVEDRIKELIKYRGLHVSPTEIENILQDRSDVEDVAVTSINLDDVQYPFAFIKKAPGAKVTEKELQKFVAEELEDWKQLRGGLKFVEEIPRLLNCKIDRTKLRELAMDIQN